MKRVMGSTFRTELFRPYSLGFEDNSEVAFEWVSFFRYGWVHLNISHQVIPETAFCNSP